MILTSLLATHASILTCIKSTFAFASASSLIQRSSTIDREFKSRHKVHDLTQIFDLLVGQMPHCFKSLICQSAGSFSVCEYFLTRFILSYAVSVIIEFFYPYLSVLLLI